MIEMLTKCDKDYGRRVAEGLKKEDKDGDNKMEEAVIKVKETGHSSDPY
jgi:catalase